MNGVITASLVGLPSLLGIAIAALITWGGPSDPQPLESIRASVAKRDRSRAPTPVVWHARDGTPMAYREYASTVVDQRETRLAVLVHGSVGSSLEMHEVATAMSAAGWTCIAPDLRGHGASGVRGDLSYVGQLEDDFADFIQLLDRQFPDARRVLIGHSAGGGFALRLARLPSATRFDGLVLMAPFLGVDAPTIKPQGGWASVGVGRLIVLQAMGKLGIHAFDHLPVISFAVSPEVASRLTPRYSYRLMQNFGPNADWRRDVSDLRLPTAVLVGTRDELFHADRFTDVFGHKAEVRLLDDIDHMGVTGEPAALRAVIDAANRSLERSNAVTSSNR